MRRFSNALTALLARLRLQLRALRSLAASWLWRAGLRWLRRPEIVYAVERPSWRRFGLVVHPALAARFPVVTLLGWFRRGPVLGAYAGVRRTAGDVSADPAEYDALLTAIRSSFPRARGVALEASLEDAAPGGRRAAPPLVSGRFGTVYSLAQSVAALVERTGRPAGETTICVVGAASEVGQTLLGVLESSHHGVVGLDPRFERTGGRRQNGKLLLTPIPADVRLGDAVLVLSHGTDAVWSCLPYVMPGQSWGDAGDPELPESLIRALRVVGVDLWRVGVYDDRMRTSCAGALAAPVPGSLLVALVARLAGGDACHDLATFSDAARRLGFQAHSVRHDAPRDTPSSAAIVRPSLLRSWTALFRRVDRDGDGRWTPAEVDGALAAPRVGISSRAWIREADLDGDGRLDFAEFVRACLVLPGSWRSVLARLPASGAG